MTVYTSPDAFHFVGDTLAYDYQIVAIQRAFGNGRLVTRSGSTPMRYRAPFLLLPHLTIRECYREQAIAIHTISRQRNVGENRLAAHQERQEPSIAVIAPSRH